MSRPVFAHSSSVRGAKQPRWHATATLKQATYMFDGDGRVMGVIVRGQRVQVNNMKRHKKLQGKPCEYLWKVKIVWLVKPQGDKVGPIDDHPRVRRRSVPPGPLKLESIEVGDVPKVVPGGSAPRQILRGGKVVIRVGRSYNDPLVKKEYRLTSGWICEGHLQAGWTKDSPIAIRTRSQLKERPSKRHLMLRPLSELIKLENKIEANPSKLRIKSDESGGGNLELHYLMREDRVINLRIGERLRGTDLGRTTLTSDTLLYSNKLCFQAMRVCEQPLYKKNSKKAVPGETVKLYLVRVVASENSQATRTPQPIGWISEKLVERAARLHVEASLPDAMISVDGAPAVRGPVDEYLRRGPHSVEVKAPGYWPSQQTVNVTPGKTTQLAVPLVLLPATPPPTGP